MPIRALSFLSMLLIRKSSTSCLRHSMMLVRNSVSLIAMTRWHGSLLVTSSSLLNAVFAPRPRSISVRLKNLEPIHSKAARRQISFRCLLDNILWLDCCLPAASK